MSRAKAVSIHLVWACRQRSADFLFLLIAPISNNFDQRRQRGRRCAPVLGYFVGLSLGSRKGQTVEDPTCNMTQAQTLIEALKHFRDARDWEQFHNPKDLALALSIEAAELNELFLWREPDDVDGRRVAEELADVFAYALLLLDTYDLDLEEIVRKKLEINEKNYPVEISRGNADKHH